MSAKFDTCWLCEQNANGESVATGDSQEPFVHICDDCLQIAGNWPYLSYFDLDILKAAASQPVISSLVWTRANCDRLERIGYLDCIDREARKGTDYLVCKYEITKAGQERAAEDAER